ncbi:YbbR domain-containing protein [Butyrivibrio fibrisolvens DSM 3071]|uniref:YbbR domain-containing protein n=1 Tax=Butyrivibrio fibrisolvens DSM 3071 TaxID=1121131 RepID=A0A1M5Z917_BUTFI|nr:CdaR family protein [Butyrivibrio fibrisolvens]SHI20403.1 YbbR domain-containing protein [Butyrivibrio fibrisolvens DSM 3071]
MKFLRGLYSNWGLKIASVLFAAVMWFLVTNINDPVSTERFTNIPVTFRNTSIISDAGEVYEVLDNTDIISSVTVRAPRSVIESFSKDNIVAIADFEKMTDDSTVPIEITITKDSGKIDSVIPSSTEVALSIENLATSTLALGATTSGTVSDGYIVSSVSTDQNQVRISGPQSVIDRIDRASVDVDVTGFTSNIGTDVSIKLYDENGSVVTDPAISMNITAVRVNVTILAIKTVPINYHTTGEPADGFMLSGDITSTPDTVVIAGKSSALSDVTSINVSDPLDVTGLTSDLQTTVNIADYLPNGISLGDADFNGICTVVVDIIPQANRTITIDAGSVTYDNVPENYKIVLGNGADDTSFTVEISGLGETIDSVSASDLNATIDLSQLTSQLSDDETLESGTYTVTVSFTPPEGVEINGTVRVTITATAPEEKEKTEDDE